MGLSAESSVGETEIQRGYAPSTMRTMLGSVGFDFLIGEGDEAFSTCDRRLSEPYLAGACLAPVGDVRGDEGAKLACVGIDWASPLRQPDVPQEKSWYSMASCRGHLATGNCRHKRRCA